MRSEAEVSLANSVLLRDDHLYEYYEAGYCPHPGLGVSIRVIQIDKSAKHNPHKLWLQVDISSPANPCIRRKVDKRLLQLEWEDDTETGLAVRNTVMYADLECSHSFVLYGTGVIAPYSPRYH
jgi:hypothetical protein